MAERTRTIERWEQEAEILRDALRRLPYEGSGPAFEALGWLTGTIRAMAAQIEYLTEGKWPVEPDANDEIERPW